MDQLSQRVERLEMDLEQIAILKAQIIAIEDPRAMVEPGLEALDRLATLTTATTASLRTLLHDLGYLQIQAPYLRESGGMSFLMADVGADGIVSVKPSLTAAQKAVRELMDEIGVSVLLSTFQLSVLISGIPGGREAGAGGAWRDEASRGAADSIAGRKLGRLVLPPTKVSLHS